MLAKDEAVMECKLCKQEKVLRNSHIIPEFLYQTLYDEKHRFHAISADEKKSTKYLQKGIRDKLLCNECEQLLSGYERYASLVLNSGYLLEVKIERSVIHIRGFDYKKFKLFALSILWRAGVSTKDAFQNVVLGRHENVLRSMIFEENPGKEESYPFILMPITHEGEVIESLVAPPEKTRVDGHNSYLFVFGGLAWVYIVTSHEVPKVVVDASIDRTGKISFLPKELKDIKYIVDTAKELVKQGKV